MEPAQVARSLLAAHESRRLSWIRERAAKLGGRSRVLDIGFESSAHRELFAHCKYSFFDLRAFLGSAREKMGPNLYHVPTASGSFDVVMCTSLFEWVLHPELALREVLRTMRRSGSLWVAPPLLFPPPDAPPRAASGLGFTWYAAAFARHGLEIGDAFAAAGLFREISEACLEAGDRLSAVELAPGKRAELEGMLLRDLPLLFADLDAKMTLDSQRGGVVLQATRKIPAPAAAVALDEGGDAAGDARDPSAALDAADPYTVSDSAPRHAQPEAERIPEPSLRARAGFRALRITYLITSITGVTGGNMTLLNQAEALLRRGHEVTIVTHSALPSWTTVRVPVIRVPARERMAPRVPPSDVVIATYFQNASELPNVPAPIRIYYAQGDQFVFEDDAPFPDSSAEALRQQLKAASAESYKLPGVRFVANSHNLARAVRHAHGVEADAVLPVCTDQTIFRPLRRPVPGSRQRILVVGPDTRGRGVESLVFKGIEDIRKGLEILSKSFSNFTAVRISNSVPEIFAAFPCEYHHVPSDEMKTFLFGTADILIYASHFDSCPRPPQEAMAAGAAVVCTETSGAMEYCVHEQNALLVPIGDPVSIAGAVIRLTQDSALRERIVQGGRRTAAEYPREREWNELEGLLYRYAQKENLV